MRILHVLSHDRLRSGGAIQARLLARGQRRLGHDVAFVADSGRDPEAARRAFGPLVEEGFEVWFAAQRRWRKVLGIRQFRRTLERFSPDVVHAHRERAVRFVHRVLRPLPAPAFFAQKGNSYRLDPRTARVYRSPRVDRIVAVADAVKKLLVLRDGVAPEKVAVVYGAFDRERFERAPDRSEARRRLDLPEHGTLVGILANLDRKKGHDLFFRAAAAVRRRRSDVAFVVAGGGDIASARRIAEREGIGEGVFWLGFRDDPEVVLAALDLSVNCSRVGEGLTGALRESLALSVPVVCTNLAGNCELVETGRTGLVVPVGDERSLASAILWMLEHRDEAQRMARAGGERVRAWMDEDRRARRVVALYEEALCYRRETLERMGHDAILHPRVRLHVADEDGGLWQGGRGGGSSS